MFPKLHVVTPWVGTDGDNHSFDRVRCYFPRLEAKRCADITSTIRRFKDPDTCLLRTESNL